MPRGLNPYAAEFVPWQAYTTRIPVTALALPEQLGSAAACNVRLNDLPDEVLAAVVAHVEDPTDVAAVARASPRLHSVARFAALRLRVAPERFFRETCEGLPALDQGHLRTYVSGLAPCFRGIRELVLRGLPLELEDVKLLLDSLPGLQVVHLAGAQKLPPHAVAALFCQQGPEAGGSCSSGREPRGVLAASLARCFQLNACALSDALSAAACPCARLRTVALSHLDLQSWPPADSAADTEAPTLLAQSPPLNGAYAPQLQPGAQQPPSGRLQILALHNCSKLDGRALACLGSAAPRLRLLLLGGCSLAPAFAAGREGPGGIAAAAAASSSVSAAMRQLRGGSPEAAALHSPLRVIGVVDEGFYIPGSAGSGAAGSGSCTGLQMLREAVESRERACGKAGALAHARAGIVAEFAALAAALPRLRALELTHFCSAIVDGVADALAALPGGAQQRRPEVWDLCRPEGVRAAQRFLAEEARSGAAAAAADVALALREAANCSSQARQTPLHAAAEAGDPAMARALLGMGGAVNARDKSGGSPLSVCAEEPGRSAAAAVLLNAGADVRAKNAAGEAPLYIAALRGHTPLVQLLLASHERAGTPWTDPELYGDGWTPLMAACVGGRVSIAATLLARAGPAAARLVHAANRYGLTAAHIAARRGSQPLLRALLEAGGGSIARRPDGGGETPIDVATKYKHEAAAKLLWDAQHWVQLPVAATPNRRPRAPA